MTDPTRLTVASLGIRAKLVTAEQDAELRALVERYEQLLCDWEGLTHRALKALCGRPQLKDERHDAPRHP
ncbi:hypothetical protein [Methylobacterium oxalidis]|uniref:hypothetical protein n=1 Tax=Methylobacterium oxalidis TaxID=944322 RepID=UPI00331492B6